jgi:uncharacterized protein (TIGR02284 family)
MTNHNIDILNDVTQAMIDSCKGYELASDQVVGEVALEPVFRTRFEQRNQLVTEFQAKVRSLGGEPQTEGGISGSIHRGFTKFSSLFRDNVDAALDAIDDGEDFLVEEIERKLEYTELSPDTRQMLMKAHASAKAGERFADRMEA